MVFSIHDPIYSLNLFYIFKGARRKIYMIWTKEVFIQSKFMMLLLLSLQYKPY